MENKNAKPGIEDVFFVWNQIHEIFRDLPDQLEEREQEKGNF